MTGPCRTRRTMATGHTARTKGGKPLHVRASVVMDAAMFERIAGIAGRRKEPLAAIMREAMVFWLKGKPD